MPVQFGLQFAPHFLDGRPFKVTTSPVEKMIPLSTPICLTPGTVIFDSVVKVQQKRRGYGKQLGVRNNLTEYRTMTRKKSNRTLKEIKAMMAEDDEFLRPMVRAVIQEFLERR